ncbi:hypothetical protein CHS0354_038733 [Potamilus streckersoni]|uniref:THD domain-containing protein n=1 Tax=Potamilus streckersoni TaxID=2493646 RepID=A0AAE0SEY6_9BIVA|nr:hypothetical protein CHS0354_038733 [Potamilus streckersoni]
MEYVDVLKDTVYKKCCIEQDNANPEDKKWSYAAVSMVLVNIILLGSILGVTITWRMEKGREPVDMKREAEMCLPCEDVYHSADDVRDNNKGFKKIMDGENYTCCGPASKHLDQLVAMYVEKAHQKETHLKLYNSNHYKCNGSTQTVKPSAHLVGVTKSVQDMHHHHTLKWNESSHLSNINGVVYNNGKLYVKTSGFYYIYSQIIYQDHGDSQTENNIGLHHSVHKEYNGDDNSRGKLLESTQSRCQIVGDRGNKTSFLGAVFYLKKEEQIHVRVSHPHKIILSQNANYFGMYLT